MDLSTREADLKKCLKEAETVLDAQAYAKYPRLAAEQDAIATILSDMDTEIVALEAKLEKARQLKQGMMQELLTGRIRLI